jgi:tetratricopeptide (TPR) repeat protein
MRYLGEFHKGITQDQVGRIIGDAKAISPLYLRVVAEELRMHGKHETVDAMIEHYVGASDLLEVFERVLERMEGDYGRAGLESVLSLLWASYSGLAETELLELIELTRLELSQLLFALEYHLIRRAGLLGFFHDYLHRALEKRYLTDEGKKRSAFDRLVQHFEKVPATLRATKELLHALELLGECERLDQVLAEIARFELLWSGTERYEVLRYWSGSERERITTAYREGIETWIRREAPQAERQVRVLGAVAELYMIVGNWEEAERMQQERVRLLRDLEDRVGESRAVASLSRLAMSLGRVEEAEGLARRAEEIARELEDRESIAVAVGNRGTVHFHRGDYERALECFQEQEKIARELEDQRSIVIYVGNRGAVHLRRVEYEQALECFQEQEKIAQELGDRQSIARSVCNRGLVYGERGEYEQALKCYRKMEEIVRELGDRQSIAMSIGNRGLIHLRRGEHEQALTCYREMEQIARELGDRQSLAVVVCNRGIVHAECGEYEQALECYRETEMIVRELGDRRGIASVVGNRGRVYVERGEYEQALECYQEMEEIMRELGDRRSLAVGAGNRGRVYVERGEYEQALKCYQEMGEIVRELGDRYHIAFVLGNCGRIYGKRREYEQALESYRQAIEECRAISVRDGLVEWLEEAAEVLVVLAEAGGVMPEYLPRYVSEMEQERWKAMALCTAREYVEESMAISGELSKHEIYFSRHLLMERIMVAETGRELAVDRISSMLDEAVDDIARAELHYWLWKISDSPDDHRTEALNLYRQLLEKIPKHDYRKRIEELNGEGS